MKINFTKFFIILFTSGFSINYGQSITVVSPNGGEVWEAESYQKITWKSSGIEKVKIEYSLDSGLSWGVITESADATEGAYVWKTADAKTPYVLIKISDASHLFIYDVSDKNFALNISKPQEKITGNSIKIMPLGDSITFGTNPDNPIETGYRRSLDSLLNSAGYNFNFVGSLTTGVDTTFDRDHEGHPKWHAYTSSPSPSQGLGSLLDTLPQFLLTNPPDVILLHIGTNDLGGQDATILINEVHNILNIIYNFDASIITIIAKIIDRNDSFTRHNRTVDFNNVQLPNLINALPVDQKNQIDTVNMYTALGEYYLVDPPNPNFSDALHPNDSGYKKMAEVWFDALVTILPPPSVIADTRIFLEGPYIGGETMSTSLINDLPLSQPYSADSIWNYAGNETVDSDFFSSHPNIVDWVLLELRSDSVTIESRRAAFLLNNGSIVDTDGVSPLRFNDVAPGNYYIVIYHRNHIPVMSSSAVFLDQFEPDSLYDFTANSTMFHGTSTGARELEPTVWGMISGDTNADGQINALDRNATWNQRNQIGYLLEDVSNDGQVNASDRNITWNNRNLTTQVP